MNEASAEKSERAIIMADFEAQTAFVDLRVEHKWGCRGKPEHRGGAWRNTEAPCQEPFPPSRQA